MPANVLAPRGLQYSRNNFAAAPNYQGNFYNIKAAYGSSIAIGDVVKTGTGGDLGYVVIAAPSDTSILGVFGGVLPFYNPTIQQTFHGINGSWPASTAANGPVPALVVSDPGAEFIAQVNGGVYDPSWRGKNITFASNGAPNFAGQSTLVLDYASLDTTNTLPFRILGVAGLPGGSQDPANTYPWIIVKMNTAEVLNPTGI
jgi:hypothetical protein